MIPKNIVHLLSGGLDSTVLLYDLQSQGQNVHCALFDYGQLHVQELRWAKLHCDRLRVQYTVIALPRLRGSMLTDGTGTTVVPNRNSILLALAVNLACAAKAECVTFAANADDEQGFPDCRRAFIDGCNATLKAAEIPVEICAPYIDKRKWWIAGLARELGVPIDQTWSCYKGGAAPCGSCPACVKRAVAIAEAMK